MIYLLLAVLCSVLIGNLLVIFTHNRNTDIRFIFLGNYIVATLFSLATAFPQGIRFSSFDLWFGALTGFLFLTNFIIYQKSITVNGLSLSVGTMRVAVIIPTLVAVLWFADKLIFLNLVGIGIIISAFVIVTDTKSFRNLFWLVFLFLISGFTESTLKVFNELGNQNQNPFLIVIFTSAGIFTLFWIAYEKRKMHWQSMLKGFALGIPNQLSSLFFLMGLKTVPATVAYPIYASGVLLFSILCDIFIWRKIFSVKQRLALGLLLIGVIVVSFSSAK
jgi:multidrug transporter EmrE-like cation transporter